MAVIRAEWIDPEIGESLRRFPDFDFSVDNVGATRSGSMFEPQSVADIKCAELTTGRGGVELSVLRPVESADEPPVLYGCTAAGWRSATGTWTMRA